MTDVCPHCGQRMLVRYGVLLSPRQADIFDFIDRATKGRGGIEMEMLAELLSPGLSRSKARNQLRVHVTQINSKLEETNFCIIGDRYSGCYRLVSRMAAE